MNSREILQHCFENPADSLGGIERNVEVKIVFLTMVELGWDPARNLGLNYQIPKEWVGCSAQASLAVDLVARDADGICVAGEVKSQHHRLILSEHKRQILKYRDALRAPLAFLTNGRKWILFHKDGTENLFDFTNANQMIEALGPYLRPGLVKGNSEQYNWSFGISHKSKSIDLPQKEILSNPIGSSEILDEVDRLAEVYPDKVYRDHTENSAQLKRFGSTDAFVEIRFGGEILKKYPKGYVVRRSKALSILPVPDDVRAHFAGYCGRELDDAPGFFSVTEQLIGYL